MAYGTENGGFGATLLFFLGAVLIAVGGAGFWYKGGKSSDSDPSGPKTCSSCQGSGRAPCGTCGGIGKANYIGPGARGVATCHACNGTKKVLCTACHGNGKIFPSRKPTASILGAHQLVCW